MNKRAVFVAFSALLAGCTTVQEMKRPNGDVEYLIACGASTGWNVCYDKANQVSPGGYITLFEKAGFNRKELRILCPVAKLSSHGSSRIEEILDLYQVAT
jgi:hypothetical protein